jgi:hypothetical protein
MVVRRRAPLHLPIRLPRHWRPRRDALDPRRNSRRNTCRDTNRPACRLSLGNWQENYSRLGLTKIESIGPAQGDPYSKTGVKVPYRIAGRKPLSGDFSLRNDIVPRKHEWLIAGGF